MKKYGIGPFLSSYTETSSECSKDLNLRPETIKLLDKNTGETLQVIEIGKDFLYKIPKAEAKKVIKMDKWGYNKLTLLCTVRETLRKEATNSRGGNICKLP